MNIFIIILIVLVCLVLSFFVLIQNPKGGGMSGTFGGFGNQVLGAKKSSDAVEKGTWYTGLLLGIIVLASFVIGTKSGNDATAPTGRKVTNSIQTQPSKIPANPGGSPVNPNPKPQAQTARSSGCRSCKVVIRKYS